MQEMTLNHLGLRNSNKIARDMNKYMTFLGSNGLTATSANHIANMAKEMVQTLEYELKNISFINSSVTIIGSVDSNVLKNGICLDELNKIESKLAEVSSMKSLIAWLCEGIKAKEALMNDLNRMTLKEWCAMEHIEYPEYNDEGCVRPKEDDYIAEMSVGQRCKYYSLQAEAAVLGKFIHQDGAYSNARKDLANKLTNPKSVEGSGRDTLLYSYSPSVDENEVEAVFFKIQKRYREVQAEMNGISHEISQKLNKAIMEFNMEMSNCASDVRERTAELNERFKVWKCGQASEIESLKIIIPHSLTDIYNKVNSLGK